MSSTPSTRGKKNTKTNKKRYSSVVHCLVSMPEVLDSIPSTTHNNNTTTTTTDPAPKPRMKSLLVLDTHVSLVADGQVLFPGKPSASVCHPSRQFVCLQRGFSHSGQVPWPLLLGHVCSDQWIAWVSLPTTLYLLSPSTDCRKVKQCQAKEDRREL